MKTLHLFHSKEHKTLGFHFLSQGCFPTKAHYNTSIWAQSEGLFLTTDHKWTVIVLRKATGRLHSHLRNSVAVDDGNSDTLSSNLLLRFPFVRKAFSRQALITSKPSQLAIKSIHFKITDVHFVSTRTFTVNVKVTAGNFNISILWISFYCSVSNTLYSLCSFKRAQLQKQQDKSVDPVYFFSCGFYSS